MRSILLLIFLYSGFSFSQTDEVVEKEIDSPVDWSSWQTEPSWGQSIIYFDAHREISDKSNDEILKTLLTANTSGCEIHFGEGEYIFKKRILLKSNQQLSGAGMDKTKLIFDIDQDHDCILAEGKWLEGSVVVEEDVPVGSNIVHTQDTKDLKVGDWVIIRSFDELVFSVWAKGKTGQISQIKEIKGNTITLEDEVRREHLAVASASIKKIDPVENVKISNLNIVRRTKSNWQTSNIQFRHCVNSRVENVDSDSCNYAHVLLEFSARCEVMNCNFADAHDYGSGGKAYGVVMQFATSECWVHDNVFKRLRHSMLLQAGANGNVFIGNKSSEPYWTGVFLPKGAAGDIVLHGNNAYANLFQENEVQTIVIDNSHYKNGPNNMFFKNDVLGYGIFMNRKNASDGQFFINNKIVKTGLFKGRYRIRGIDHFESGNIVKGKIRPKKGIKVKNKTFFK